jgi:hypothetical protein
MQIGESTAGPASAQGQRIEPSTHRGELKVRLLDRWGNPRANLEYELRVHGRTISGRADGQGRIEVRIPARVHFVRLVAWRAGADGERVDVIRRDLRITALDDGASVAGLKARLSNLGLYRGAIDGEEGPAFRRALRQFQAQRGLRPHGAADGDSKARVQQDHDG